MHIHTLLKDQIKEHLPAGSEKNPSLQKFLNAVNASYKALHDANNSGNCVNSEVIEALRLSEEKYRNILEKSTDVIYKTNRFGFFTYVNPVMERTTGYSKKELKQKHFSELIREDYRKMAATIYKEQVALKKASSYYEFPIIIKDGTEKWIGQSVQYTQLNEKEHEFTALAIDITDRKLAEKTVTVNEEKYRNIIANIHLGLVEVDRHEVIRYCNQAFCELSGYDKEELIGHNILDRLVFEESKHELRNKTDQRLKGLSDIYEIQIKNKKGEIRWWMVSGAPNYDDAGNLIGSIGIHLDVTERKRLEQELKLSKQKAEESSRAKEAFLANMSHEIRTPLNAIIGMIRELSYENLTDKQKMYVAHTSTASQHLLSVLNNILDISKIEAGEFHLEEQNFEIQTILNDVVLMMRTTAQKKNLYLNASFSQGLHKTLVGDPTRIKQVILNLVGNAVKFTESGGVHINCELEKETAHEQSLLITVNDTGIGMEENYVENMFTKFSQEDVSTARNYGGTGLGMSISKELIKLMHGEIMVKSIKNSGTSITLKMSLPIGTNANAETAVLRKTYPNIRVLLVEDNEFNQLVATKTLERNNCQVSLAINGKEAVEALEQGSIFDVILMDLQMPVMGGLEATKIIRKKLNNTTPIIALSANAFKTESDICFAEGMNDYVTKPFEEKVLMERILKTMPLRETLQISQSEIPVQKKLYSMSNLLALSGGDKEYLEKLVDVYIRQTNQSLIQLKEAVKMKNLKHVFEISHQMKSGIDSFNIESLKTEIREIETDARKGLYSERMETLVSHSEEILKKVIQEIRAEFYPDEDEFRPLYETQP